MKNVEVRESGSNQTTCRCCDAKIPKGELCSTLSRYRTGLRQDLFICSDCSESFSYQFDVKKQKFLEETEN